MLLGKCEETERTEKCHTTVLMYDDVVLIVTPKHNVVTQVFKDSIGILVVIGYCWEIVTRHSQTGCNYAKYLLLRSTRR